MMTLKRYGKNVWRFVRHTRAVSALEYAILVGAIAIAIAIAVGQFGDSIGEGMKAIGEKVEGVKMKDIGKIGK